MQGKHDLALPLSQVVDLVGVELKSGFMLCFLTVGKVVVVLPGVHLSLSPSTCPALSS